MSVIRRPAFARGGTSPNRPVTGPEQPAAPEFPSILRHVSTQVFPNPFGTSW